MREKGRDVASGTQARSGEERRPPAQGKERRAPGRLTSSFDASGSAAAAASLVGAAAGGGSVWRAGATKRERRGLCCCEEERGRGAAARARGSSGSGSALLPRALTYTRPASPRGRMDDAMPRVSSAREPRKGDQAGKSAFSCFTPGADHRRLWPCGVRRIECQHHSQLNALVQWVAGEGRAAKSGKARATQRFGARAPRQVHRCPP